MGALQTLSDLLAISIGTGLVGVPSLLLHESVEDEGECRGGLQHLGMVLAVGGFTAALLLGLAILVVLVLQVIMTAMGGGP